MGNIQSFKTARELKPSVHNLTNDQVMYAIQTGGEDNLILQEVTNLVNSYLRDCAELGGGGLDALLAIVPTCPIEEIALGMAIAAEQAKINKVVK